MRVVNKGREFYIEVDQGRLPKELQGSFTSKAMADIAVATFQAMVRKKMQALAAPASRRTKKFQAKYKGKTT